MPYIQRGEMRLLAVTTPDLPEMPTVQEGGLRGVETLAWNGILAARARIEAQ